MLNQNFIISFVSGALIWFLTLLILWRIGKKKIVERPLHKALFFVSGILFIYVVFALVNYLFSIPLEFKSLFWILGLLLWFGLLKKIYQFSWFQTIKTGLYIGLLGGIIVFIVWFIVLGLILSEATSTLKSLPTPYDYGFKEPQKNIIAEPKEETKNFEGWNILAVESSPGVKFQIKYPHNWGASDLRFPCNNINDIVLSVISPTRINLKGYEGVSAAYLVQFCVGNEAMLLFQGFIKAPLSVQPSTQDMIILPSIWSTDEYQIAQQIIATLSNE